jgi:pyridoxal phosphate enzyme (YggS family)
MSIADNLAAINQRIHTAAETAGRDPSTVRLVAVSKTRPAADISEAFRAGQRLFGENYIQELVPKLAELQEAVEWHVIGHLQSNKVKYIAGQVAMIHSVDRLSLATEIDRQWGRVGKVCDVLIQMNISGEITKSGTSVDEVLQLVRDCSLLPNIAVKGLMTMPPFFDDPDAARPYFAELRRVAAVIAAEKIEGVAMDELSMGMSGDFEAAIQEGATLVRVGTAIFGAR